MSVLGDVTPANLSNLTWQLLSLCSHSRETATNTCPLAIQEPKAPEFAPEYHLHAPFLQVPHIVYLNGKFIHSSSDKKTEL